MTFAELREYRAIKARLDLIERRLKKERIHVADTVQSAARFPYWLHTELIEGDLYTEKGVELLCEKKALEKKKKRVEIFVGGIGNILVRQALELKYLEPESEDLTFAKWEDVARAIGYGSGEALRMVVCRYIKKIS